MSRVARQSTEAEIAALEQVCERLANFGADISLEWVDGYLTALLASRRVITPSEWLPPLFGDDFERVFADPDDVQQALAAGRKPKYDFTCRDRGLTRTPGSVVRFRCPEIGTTIYQNPRVICLHNSRGTQSIIFQIGRSTNRTCTADLRYSRRCSTSYNSYFHLFILNL